MYCASVKSKGEHEIEDAEQVGKDLGPTLKGIRRPEQSVMGEMHSNMIF